MLHVVYTVYKVGCHRSCQDKSKPYVYLEMLAEPGASHNNYVIDCMQYSHCIYTKSFRTRLGLGLVWYLFICFLGVITCNKSEVDKSLRVASGPGITSTHLGLELVDF